MNKKIIFQKIKKYVFPIITIVAIGSAVFMYLQLRSLNKDPQAEAKKEATELNALVGEFVLLPEGEIPTIATVSDPAALKDQSFFNNAQKGDKVLIYSQAKKAILYRESINKIIEIAPLNNNENKTNTIENSNPEPVPVSTSTPKKTTTVKKK